MVFRHMIKTCMEEEWNLKLIGTKLESEIARELVLGGTQPWDWTLDHGRPAVGLVVWWQS